MGSTTNNAGARESSRSIAAYNKYAAAFNQARNLVLQASRTADAERDLSLCQSALNSINKALQYAPGDANAQILRSQIVGCIDSCNGDLAAKNGEYDRAIGLYREAESSYPPNSSIFEQHIAWAESMRQQAIGNANAKAEADRAAEKKAQIDALWSPGLELGHSQDYKAAEAIWHQVIALDPQDSAAYFNLGMSLYYQDRNAEAEAALRKSIELNPNDSSAQFWLGNLLVGQNRAEEAEAALRRAIQLDPKNSNAQFLLGALLDALNRYAEAEAALRQAVQLDPKNSTAEFDLGDVLKAQHRYAEAEEAYRKALQLSPGDADTQQALQSVIDLEAKAQPPEQESKQGKPAVAQVEAHGEFSFLTSDGRKLTGQDANSIPLEEGGTVVTGSDGHVRLVLPDETVFTVGPNSNVVIDRFVYDPASDEHTIMAKLSQGVFRWVTGKVARKDPAKMKVTLPVGTIGIRGTDFEATVEADGSGVVKLSSGELQITESKTGRVFILNAGETVTFGPDGYFSQPK